MIEPKSSVGSSEYLGDGTRPLGECAPIDAEAYAGSCVATEPSPVAVLRRENLAQVVTEQPTLGAKILIGLMGIFPARRPANRARPTALLDAQPTPDDEEGR